MKKYLLLLIGVVVSGVAYALSLSQKKPAPRNFYNYAIENNRNVGWRNTRYKKYPFDRGRVLRRY